MTLSDSNFNSIKKENEFAKLLIWFDCNKLCLSLNKKHIACYFQAKRKTKAIFMQTEIIQ